MSNKFLSWVAWSPLLIAGCAQTVEVASKAPQTTGSARVQRIAVLNVDGPEQYSSAATDRLVQRLKQSGKYDVVDEQTLQQAAPERIRDGKGKLRKHIAGEAGRRMRLDALVVSSLRTRDSRREGGLRFGYPVVTATTMYTWVELPSGRIRDSHQAQHGEQVKGSGGDELPKCVEASVDKLANRLAPNLEVVSHNLAGSQWFGALSEGNRLAAEGKWQAAEAAWTAVTQGDPENDGGWYNLGVAAEFRGDHQLAQQRYRRAQQIDDRDEYSLALKQLEERLESQRIAQRRTERFAPTRQYQPRRY